MSTKNIIISLIGVIVIFGAIYFAMSKNSSNKAITQTPPVATTTKSDTPGVTAEPTAAASNDAIIDYIVDGQSADITAAAQAELKTSVPDIAEPTISTNF